MKYLTVLLASIVLTSCSSFEFKTNLDPQNFKEYFKPSYVTEVDEDDLCCLSGAIDRCVLEKGEENND